MRDAPRVRCPVCRVLKPVTPAGKVAPHFLSRFGQCPGGGRAATPDP